MKITFCFLCSFLLATTSFAEDVEFGKDLHDNNCTACHNKPEFYTHKDRKRKTYESLEHQVRNCDNTLDLAWFDEEIEDVTYYLNVTYYRFQKPGKN